MFASWVVGSFQVELGLKYAFFFFSFFGLTHSHTGEGGKGSMFFFMSLGDFFFFGVFWVAFECFLVFCSSFVESRACQ